MKFDKKILTILMEWDYCDRSRGVSPDKLVFYDAVSRLVSKTEAFWYDDYIKDLSTLRRLALKKAEEFNPDLIFFVPFTDQFDPATLDAFKSRWPTYAWFGDDNWRFDNYTSKLAGHFTHVSTTDMYSVEKYRKIGIEPMLTQWAGQLLGGPRAALGPGGAFRYDVSFIGGVNPVRKWFIGELARRGIKTECFGHGWKNGRISFQEMERIFNESRINLNLSNSVSRDIRFVLGSPLNLAHFLRSAKDSEQMKARNFEIPLAGGFQLTNYVCGLERHLRIGEEVAAYGDLDECARQIRYYLANEDERCRVAAAGQTRAAAEHTYIHRLEAIFGRIFK